LAVLFASDHISNNKELWLRFLSSLALMLW